MLIDLHTHTFPASRCSAISTQEYIERCVRGGIRAIALTNHGDLSDNVALEPLLAAKGILLIRGVEISTQYGDFVVFSPDPDFLTTLRDVQPAPRPGDVPDDAAVVWVHPTAGGGRSRSVYYTGLEREVANLIDAVEVYNGNWLGKRYVTEAEAIAKRLGLPRTGGSDAHEADRIMRCSTEFPDSIRSTADVVAAIKRGHTTPHRRRSSPFDRLRAKRRPV